jgi:benzodiazapine receptor
VAAFLGFVGLCLLVGAASGSVTADAVQAWYPSLAAPRGTPPNWVFAPVWTTLYFMIGVAGWLVWLRPDSFAALRLWGWQLAANVAWSSAFFGMRSTGLGLLVILLLLALICLTLRAFHRKRREAAWLLVPYLAWTVYASYLNAGFWWLNRT